MSIKSRTRVPPLLEPLICLPPEASLTLITGVLDATPYWLIPRYLGAFLTDDARNRATEIDTPTDTTLKVVLVSWMRDFEFWQSGARRGGGIDLSRLAEQGRFAFVDGLTGLFSDAVPTGGAAKENVSQRTTPVARPNSLPVRGPAPARSQPAQSPTAVTAPQQAQKKGRFTLTSPTLQHASNTINGAISSLNTTASEDKVLLILDAPSLLLSTTSTTATELSTFVLSLREKVHSTLLIVETDTPFLAAANPNAFYGSDYLSGSAGQGMASGGASFTPLEKEHAAFVAAQAHNAVTVIGTRGLDTGVARDVSGVLRVARGGGWDDEVQESSSPSEHGHDMEVLYHVQADGNVRVFERGAGDVG